MWWGRVILRAGGMLVGIIISPQPCMILAWVQKLVLDPT